MDGASGNVRNKNAGGLAKGIGIYELIYYEIESVPPSTNAVQMQAIV